MGFYSSYDSTKDSVIKECLEISEQFQLLKHSVCGNCLWMVVERKDTKDRFISLCLIEKVREGEWGYKPMDEMCGPCYYNCPLSFFKLVPDDSKYVNLSWRAKVRQYYGKV